MRDKRTPKASAGRLISYPDLFWPWEIWVRDYGEAREASDLNFLNQVRTNCISAHSVETELLL